MEKKKKKKSYFPYKKWFFKLVLDMSKISQNSDFDFLLVFEEYRSWRFLPNESLETKNVHSTGFFSVLFDQAENLNFKICKKKKCYALTRPDWWPDEEEKFAQMDKKMSIVMHEG